MLKPCLTLWWGLRADAPPTFEDMGLVTPAGMTDYTPEEVVEWMCAREQLWAMREGLA
jgi:hypothetical protein